jgi:hypothetical protein
MDVVYLSILGLRVIEKRENDLSGAARALTPEEHPTHTIEYDRFMKIQLASRNYL